MSSNANNNYENCPYPQYSPDEEQKNYDAIDEVSWLKTMKEETGFIPRDGMMILVAGCGTGNELIYLTKCLKDYNVFITAFDLSSNSLQMAKDRMERLGLNYDHINFFKMDILDIPSTLEHTFDFISCRNVLHHIERSTEALFGLKKCLKPDGLLCLQLYATIGRTTMGITTARELIMKATASTDDFETKKKIAKQILAQLPPHHMLKCFEKQTDLGMLNDAGLVDTLLNPVVKGYTIPTLYDWMEECGLEIVNFLGQQRALLEHGIARGENKRVIYTLNELFHNLVTNYLFVAKIK